MPKLKISEHQLQCLCFGWVNMKERQDSRYAAIYAIPNGGYRHATTASKLKREGVRAGELDINIDYPSRGFHGARLELKVGSNKPSWEQEKVMVRHKANGYAVAVIKTFEQFQLFCQEYFR